MKREMNTVRSLVLIVFCSASYALSSMEQSLQSSYQSEKSSLDTLLSDLTSFPDSVKNSWASLITDAEKKIDEIYRNASEAIKPWAIKAKSKNMSEELEAAQQISSIVDLTLPKMVQISLDIRQKLTSYLQSQQAILDKANFAKAEAEAKKIEQAQLAYQQKMVVELEAIQKIYVPLNKVLDNTQLFVLESYKKPYNSSHVEDIVKQWQSVADFAYKVYSGLGPINVNDPNNLLIVIIKNISNFLLDRIYDQLYALRDKKLSDDYYEAVSAISIRLLGTHNLKDSFLVRDGFDGVMQSTVKKYFTDVNQQATVLNYYLQNKIKITYNLYKNALANLVNTISDPSEQERSYALAMYNLLMSELDLVSPDDSRAKIDLPQINSTMALLYINSAQALIKKMQIKVDTTPIITDIIEFYKQAASYFTKALEGTQAQTYTQLAKNLSDALSTLAQAKTIQKSGDLSKTISLYKQAQASFVQGADLLDSNKITGILVDLESRYALTTAHTLFTQFETSNKALIENYLDYCNKIESSMPLEQRNQLFSNLLQLYQTAYGYFNDAAITYKTAVDNNSPLTQSTDTEDINNNLSFIPPLLTTLIQAYELIQKGDRLLSLKTIANLQDAESTYYQNAINLFKNVDALYVTHQQLMMFVPNFFSKKVLETPFNFEILMQRYIAKFCIELASQLTQSSEIELAYYTNAQNRNSLLPLAFQNLLASKIAQLVQSKDSVDKLFIDAQNNEKKLMLLTQEDWAPKKDSAYYISVASQQWQNLLQQYVSWYHYGKIEAKAAFINAVNEYAENYKKYVVLHSEVGLAMIWYQQFILHCNDNELQEAASVKLEIDKLLDTTYSTVQGLISSVANQTNLHTTATFDQESIIAWSGELNQAIIQQDSIIKSIGVSLSAEQGSSLLFLSKELKDTTQLYNFLSLKKTLEIVDPILKLADLYKKIGDYYFEKKNYKIAYPSYIAARQKYTDANKPITDPDFKQRIALTYTLYLASQYRDLIIPKGQNSIVGLQVPESYELQVFGQVVPPELSDQFPNLDFLKNDSGKTMSFLIDLVTQLYLYNKLQDLFGSGAWATFSPLISLSSKDLFQNTVFLALSDNHKTAFVTTVAFAAKMKATLTDRANKKTTNFVLQQQSNRQFIVYTYYIPIPRLTDGSYLQDYYSGYPAVITYYTWAANLFKPGKADEMVSVGHALVPPGNDPDAFDAMITAQVKTYLSQGYLYQEEYKKLQDSAPWKNLIKASKSDMTITIDTYSDMKNSVDNFFNLMRSYYTTPLASNLVPSTNPLTKSLHDLVGKTYKDWGDALGNFLIGDPLVADYVSILKDMLEKYVVAITTYNFDTSLYLTIAQKYNDAGEVLIGQNKYFDSISYFYTAASICKRIVPQTATIQKTIDQYYVNYLSALTKGSTIKMGQFQKDLTEPISISNNGAEEKITFNDLLIKASNNDISPDEATMMDDIKNLVLDALIYYNNANAYITQGIESINEPSIFVWLGIDDKTLGKVHESALSLLNTFSEKNGIAFDTTTSINDMMTRTNFPDGKDFVEMINNGFALFENKIKSSTDAFNRAVGYSAIAQFAVKLYEAFSKVYINTFYGTVSTTSYTSLTSAIQVRINEILSPANLYIGN